jgi:hypothetical protein
MVLEFRDLGEPVGNDKLVEPAGVDVVETYSVTCGQAKVIPKAEFDRRPVG